MHLENGETDLVDVFVCNCQDRVYMKDLFW